MDKKSFISTIKFEDDNLLSNLYDKIKLAEKISRPVFTSEFYPPNVWKIVKDMNKSFNINIYTCGIFEESERKMLCMAQEEPEKYPAKLIKIQNKSKFESLDHRDYLGAIMALGIKREKYGDLILDGNNCYAAVSEEISDYILYNLTSIGRCPCKVDIIDDYSDLNISARYEDFMLHSTSLRLDCIVSSICSLSRAKAVELIQASKVLIDYVDINEKDKVIEAGTVITVRGYGKFKFIEQIGSTQRGRLKLSMKKYI
ncbi:YlmH/Sll1252 family protein [Clostridium swellfunianum]|uniref:YlmH family RNA-binding protein n=1 Tax=Clostridium swellfunianum TaxID=1367462 RepID=UPI002030249D|nr:YlmH/Sll1252 family protein [Clostridium swellfunianum]MCM0650405.1 YlmH/Sll1252 family protein [Clostridium swellfunianum]